MCGCPLVCKKISNGFEHEIGCGHVSGLGFAALHMPRAGMELPAKARRTITHDNGGEFARHEAVTAATGMRAFGAALEPVALAPHSVIRTAHGNAARSRTPTVDCAGSFPARPTLATTPMTTSTM